MLSQEEGFSPKSSQDRCGCYGGPLVGASYIHCAEDFLFSARGEEDEQEDGAEETKKGDSDSLHTEIRQDLPAISAMLGISRITGKDYLRLFQKHFME